MSLLSEEEEESGDTIQRWGRVGVVSIISDGYERRGKYE
jgi:hypothetical protein